MDFDPNTIKDWLIPVASFVGILSTAVGVWLALKEYRLKLAAEKRLTESARAETDIRLLTHFTDILEIATGRKRDPVYSKEVVDKLLEKLEIDPNAENFDYTALQGKLKRAALFEPVVGLSSIDAAFASITTLAQRHAVLVPSAIQALESFSDWKPELSNKYLVEVKKIDKESHNEANSSDARTSRG